jgi:hypothetical protein
MNDERHRHWNEVYATKGEADVSWYQARPTLSLKLIGAHVAKRSASVIDVGGGTSRLVDGLLAEGYSDLTVLDVSTAALSKSKQRIGARSSTVHWIVADVTRWTPHRCWQVWHDRAVFHFLTTTADQDAYLTALHRGTELGSVLVMATFALDGPERCSGLPVQRYSPETLGARLGGGYQLLDSKQDIHLTPGRTIQKFNYAVFVRQT